MIDKQIVVGEDKTKNGIKKWNKIKNPRKNGKMIKKMSTF